MQKIWYNNYLQGDIREICHEIMADFFPDAQSPSSKRGVGRG